MGLFDKIKEPVFLKESSSASTQLAELQELAETAPSYIRARIEQDMKILSAGIFGEENIAFELRNSHMPMIILHDLYLTYGELSAQIDYLIITRKRNFVVECKNLIGDIEINSNGDFIRTINYNGKNKKEGIYSPITQNQRHMELIKLIRSESKGNFLTKALFEKNFYENYRSVVVLANPKTILNAKYAKKEVKKQVIRADQLVAYIKNVNSETGIDPVGEKQMEELAQFFYDLHKESPMDYVHKYRTLIDQGNETRRVPHALVLSLPNTAETEAKMAVPIEQNLPEAGHDKLPPTTGESGAAAPYCPKCGAPMVKRKATRGANIDSEFYGCSNFPKCRSIINIIQNMV